jgi:hypothetical protein
VRRLGETVEKQMVENHHLLRNGIRSETLNILTNYYF